MAKVEQEKEGLTKEQIKEQKRAEKEAKKAEKEALKNGKKKKAKKEKKGGVGKKFKETVSELKKVSWPGFGTVVKKTGVVLAVVVIFTVVLFGFDYVLGLLYNLFTSQL